MRKVYHLSALVALTLLLGLSSTRAQSPYCAPSFTSASYEWISNVTFAGINNSTAGNPSYNNYTSQVANVATGGTYQMSVSINPDALEYVWAFIDWNQNNKLDDAGEVYTIATNTASSGPFNVNITVPQTATPGTTRLRVLLAYAYSTPDPCMIQYYGEVEDYSVAVAPPVDNDAGLAEITQPSEYPCSIGDSISVKVTNSGSLNLTSCTINWSINGGTPSTKSWTGNLASATVSNPYFIGTATMNDGDKLKVWTSNPNSVQDSFPANDTISRTLTEALGGTYTVGGSSPDYVNIGLAITDLMNKGVCGNVIMKIASGSYNYELTLNEIPGAGPNSTITFEPASTGTVTYEYTPSSLNDNWVIKLDGADYVIFNNIVFQVGSGAVSYGTVLEINNGASYNQFNNCQFNGISLGTSTYTRVIYCYSSDNNYNKFINNDINGGYYNMYFYGSGTSAFNKGCEFIGNSFKDSYYYGAMFYYAEDLIFMHNSVTSSTTVTSHYPLYFYYINGASRIIGNYENTPAYYGMYASSINGTANNPAIIANNMLRAGRGTGYGYGLYYYGGFSEVVYNTIVCDKTTNGSYYGLYIGGGANTVMNNILWDQKGSGSSYYALYYSGTFAVAESDYNDIYYANKNFGYFNAIQATLSNWQTATGFDMHSLTTDPAFADFDVMRTCNDTLDGAGFPISNVLDDIDKDDRHPTTPDIGADEWVGSDSGSYSAGPDAIICQGKTAQIGLKVTGGSFMWSNNDTTSTIIVNQEGTYTVTMTTDCGATHTDEVVVTDVTPVATFSTEVSYRTGKFMNASTNGNSYRWIVGVTPPDTLWNENMTYVFPNNGPFEVCLTVYNDCDTVESCATWMSSVGIDEFDLAGMISLRPNPVSDQLTIQFTGMEVDDIAVEMSNLQGQVVFTENFVNVSGNSNKQIDVSSLKSGMYILKFSTDKQIVAKRIVVE